MKKLICILLLQTMQMLSNTTFAQYYGSYKTFSERMQAFKIKLSFPNIAEIYHIKNFDLIAIPPSEEMVWQGTFEKKDSLLHLIDSNKIPIGTFKFIYDNQLYTTKTNFVSNGKTIDISNNTFLRTELTDKKGLPIESGEWISGLRAYEKHGIWVYYDLNGNPKKRVLFYLGQVVQDPFVYKHKR